MVIHPGIYRNLDDRTRRLPRDFYDIWLHQNFADFPSIFCFYFDAAEVQRFGHLQYGSIDAGDKLC